VTADSFPDAQREGVYRAIAARRDIRNYRPDPLPDEVLLRLLDAAHRAPSVGMMQPWDFILLRDRGLRQSAVYDHFRDVNERASQVYEDDRQRSYRALKLQGILDAPLNLVVTCDRKRGGPHVLGRFTMRHMDEYSTCLAVQNLWLAARAEGVGVGWLSLLEPEVLSSLLGLPEHVLPVAYLTLGYPVSFPEEPLLERSGWRERLPLEQLLHEDRYGAPLRQPLRGAPALAGRTEATHIAPVDSPSAPLSAQRRQQELTKPTGSLGRLEELGLLLAALQGREHPSCRAPALLLFAGDHGVTAEGVSAYLPCATAQMVYQYLAGGAAVNVLCRQHGVALHVADVGVDHDFGSATGLAQLKVRRGTRNFSLEAAMTADELARALAAGAALVERVPESEVIGLGEMGIGNTTASTALLAALTGLPAAQLVGRGTGISDATLERKRAVVQRAVALHAPHDASEALRCLGGLEIAALVGAIEAAAERGRLVVLDGFITGVAALIAVARRPGLRRYLLASHQSAEPAHALVLQQLGCVPLLDLGLRLGEGSGAVLAISLLDSAARLMREMRTFAEANLERPLDPRDSALARPVREAAP
jgi:nicotinate-nucleotide--dimethylbenzimidazole phosphoribosyltransferase